MDLSGPVLSRLEVAESRRGFARMPAPKKREQGARGLKARLQKRVIDEDAPEVSDTREAAKKAKGAKAKGTPGKPPPHAGRSSKAQGGDARDSHLKPGSRAPASSVVDDAMGEFSDAEPDAPDDSVDEKLEDSSKKIMPGENEGETVPQGKRKTCVFLCGAICWVTPDPTAQAVQGMKRKSIRWAYDKDDFLESSGRGYSCWYCDRTWEQEAYKEPGRDRADYLAELSKNGDTLASFGGKRKQQVMRTIEKAKKSKAAKRSGRGRAARSSWPSDSGR